MLHAVVLPSEPRITTGPRTEVLPFPGVDSIVPCQMARCGKRSQAYLARMFPLVSHVRLLERVGRQRRCRDIELVNNGRVHIGRGEVQRASRLGGPSWSHQGSVSLRRYLRDGFIADQMRRQGTIGRWVRMQNGNGRMVGATARHRSLRASRGNTAGHLIVVDTYSWWYDSLWELREVIGQRNACQKFIERW